MFYDASPHSLPCFESSEPHFSWVGSDPFISLGPQVGPTSACRSGSLSLTGGQSAPVSPVHLSRDT